MMRNVAILVLDSVRKDFFDLWADRIRTESDVSVTRAYAPSSWSTPSHASMVLGEHPSEHGVHTYNRSFAGISREDSLTAHSSHETIGVSANMFAGSTYDFDRFFDTFFDVSPTRRFPSGLDPVGYDSPLQYALDWAREPATIASLLNGITGSLHHFWKEIPAPKLVDDSGRAVRRVATSKVNEAVEPWLLFVNFMDAHIPLQHFRGLDRSIHGVSTSWCSDRHDVWELMAGEYPDYWSTRENVYSAYIEYLDRVVSGFIETVQRRTENPTTVIVTADHGENHGEESADGMANHKSSLSEQLLHVPLEIVNPPESASSVDGACTLLDLPQLVESIIKEEWYDLEREIVPAEVLGMSAGPEPPSEVDQEYYRRGIRAAYRGDTKIVWDSLGTCRRYLIDRPSDQTLVDDGIDVPDWASSQFSTDLNEAIANARSTTTTTPTISESANSRLEELGYK